MAEYTHEDIQKLTGRELADLLHTMCTTISHYLSLKSKRDDAQMRENTCITMAHVDAMLIRGSLSGVITSAAAFAVLILSIIMFFADKIYPAPVLVILVELMFYFFSKNEIRISGYVDDRIIKIIIAAVCLAMVIFTAKKSFLSEIIGILLIPVVIISIKKNTSGIYVCQLLIAYIGLSLAAICNLITPDHFDAYEGLVLLMWFSWFIGGFIKTKEEREKGLEEALKRYEPEIKKAKEEFKEAEYTRRAFFNSPAMSLVNGFISNEGNDISGGRLDQNLYNEVYAMYDVVRHGYANDFYNARKELEQRRHYEEMERLEKERLSQERQHQREMERQINDIRRETRRAADESAKRTRIFRDFVDSQKYR